MSSSSESSDHEQESSSSESTSEEGSASSESGSEAEEQAPVAEPEVPAEPEPKSEPEPEPHHEPEPEPEPQPESEPEPEVEEPKDEPEPEPKSEEPKAEPEQEPTEQKVPEAEPQPQEDKAQTDSACPPEPEPCGFVDLTPQLLEDLPKQNAERSFIVKTLVHSVKWETALFKFMSTVGGIFDSVKREDCFSLFLGLINERDDLTVLDDAKLTKLVLFIAGYRNVIVKFEVCLNMVNALQKCFDTMTQDGRQAAIASVEADAGKYASLALVAYGIKYELQMDKILAPLTPKNYPAVQALIVLYNKKQFSDLSDEQKQLLTESQQGFTDLMLKGDDQSKVLGIGLLEANFNFKLGGADPEAVLPYDVLISLLHGQANNVRLAVVRLFTKLPVQSSTMSADTQLLTVLTHICEHLTSADGEYAQACFEFIEARKTLAPFYEFLCSLFLSDSTLRGAMIVCAELGLFRENADLATSAFPPSVKPKRLLYATEAVKYLVSKGNLTQQLIEASLSHLLLIYTSSAILKKPDQKRAAVESVEYLVKGCQGLTSCLADILIKEIVNITDVDILQAFATAIGKIEIEKPQPPSDDLFCKMFCHVFSLVKSYTDIRNIVSLFVEISDKTDPETPVELVDRVVPAAFKARLLTTAEASLKEQPRLAVFCAAMPDIAEQKLWELVKFVLTADDVFTFDLGLEFFTTLGIRYFPFTLLVWERQKLGEQVTGNILVARKKRIRAIEAVKAAFASLPIILKGRELDTAQQESLWKGICATIPNVKYEEVRDQAIKLHEVFPYIKDVTPTEEQYKKLLRPEFARDFPVFLANVPPNEELAQTCVKLWFKLTRVNRHLCKDTTPLAELVFRLSQNQKTLFDAIFCVKKERLPQSEKAIPFAYYVWAMAEAAHKVGVHADEIVYINFFLYFSSFNISSIAELRNASVAALAAVFNLENAPKESGAELTPDQVVSVALNLYTELVKSTSDRFTNLVLKRIIEKNKYVPHHGYILRAILEVEPNLITENNRDYLLQLFSKFTSFSPLVRHHFEKGVMTLAARSMKEFIPLLMVSDTGFKRLILERILRSYTIRPLFITEFFQYLNMLPVQTKSLEPFELLKKIIFTEPSNELDDEAYGRLLSEVLMWLGLVHALLDKLNLIEINNQQTAIYETIEMILGKTTLPRTPEQSLDSTTVKKIATTIDYICLVNCSLSIAKIRSTVQSSLMMLDSPNESYTTSAGIFYVHMLARFLQYKSEAAKALHQELTSSILKAFQGGTGQSKLEISAASYKAMPKEVLEAFDGEQISVIYQAVVTGLKEGKGKLCIANAMLLLSEIIERVPEASIDSESLFIAIKAGFDGAEFSPAFLRPLSVYLKSGASLEKFTVDDSNLSVYWLFRDLKYAEDDTLQILRTISKSDDIVSGLSARYGAVELARCGKKVLKYAKKPYSPAVVQVLCAINEAVKDCNEPIALKFKKASLRPLLDVAEAKDGNPREVAIAAIDAIVK